MGEGSSLRRDSYRMHHQQRQSTFESSSTSLNKDNKIFLVSKRWGWLIRETQAVSLWSCTSMLFRFFFQTMVSISFYNQDEESLQLFSNYVPFRLPPNAAKNMLLTVSLFVGWIILCLPSKLVAGKCSGFFVSNPAILLWVRDKTGVIPCLPVRCCEYMMGRNSLGSMLAIVPVHFLTCYGTGFFFRHVFHASVSAVMLAAPEYTTAKGPWIVDLSQQVLLTAVFSVSILVLPVLFRLNRIPQCIMIFMMYPLYQISVDQSGMGDLYSPNFLLMIALNNKVVLPIWRFLGSIIGGLLAGIVMNNYFPDGGYSFKTD